MPSEGRSRLGGVLPEAAGVSQMGRQLAAHLLTLACPSKPSFGGLSRSIYWRLIA